MRQTWAHWRLILDGGFDYNAVWHQMNEEEIALANAALDLWIKNQPKMPQGKQRGRRHG